MADVVMFTSNHCAFCSAAKRYLQRKGVRVQEINVTGVAGARDVLKRMTGSATVPQIFISDVHIGGYEELRALDAAGELDALLAHAPAPRVETSMSLSF